MGSDIACNVVSFGECMIELRSVGPRLLRQGFAGDTLNAAVYLARLRPDGVAVRYAMGIGTDRFALAMRDAWREEGIDDSLVREVPGRSCGLYTILVDESGERHFSYWRDSSAARAYFDTALTPLELAVDNIDLLYLSGISVAILPEPARERLMTVIRQVRARGGRVAWDNNFRPRLWPVPELARDTLARFCVESDIALLTLDDELALQPERSRDAVLASAFALPCAEVVIKRGAEPTWVRAAGSAAVEVPVQAIARPLDTTAAGDAFGGAYLAARLRGLAPPQAAAAGNRLAATVVQHPGAIIPVSAMPESMWDGL